jgi:hypothetical protein
MRTNLDIYFLIATFGVDLHLFVFLYPAFVLFSIRWIYKHFIDFDFDLIFNNNVFLNNLKDFYYITFL